MLLHTKRLLYINLSICISLNSCNRLDKYSLISYVNKSLVSGAYLTNLPNLPDNLIVKGSVTNRF